MTRKLPPTCKACRQLPRAPGQRWCGPCSRVARLVLTQRERRKAREIVLAIAPAYYGQQQGQQMVAAAVMVQQGRNISSHYRIHFGVLVWAWCDSANRLGMRDVDGETLYRKLTGHDRLTLARAPWPRDKASMIA